MAEWGQINKGQRYGVMCVDIDRAIAHMKLTPLEQMLLQYVREQCWGVTCYKTRDNPWPDPAHCYLNITALAEEWGVSRSRLQDAKGALIQRGVIEDMCGRVTINKDVSAWKGLSRKSLEYAMRGISVASEGENVGVPDRAQQIQSPECNGVPDRAQGCARPGTGGVPDRAQGVCPIGHRGVPDRAQSQVLDRACEEDIQKIKRDEERSSPPTPPRGGDDQDRTAPEDSRSVPDPDPDRPPAYPHRPRQWQQIAVQVADVVPELLGLDAAWYQDREIPSLYRLAPDELWMEVAARIRPNLKGKRDPIGYYRSSVANALRDLAHQPRAVLSFPARASPEEPSEFVRAARAIEARLKQPQPESAPWPPKTGSPNGSPTTGDCTPTDPGSRRIPLRERLSMPGGSGPSTSVG